MFPTCRRLTRLTDLDLKARVGSPNRDHKEEKRKVSMDLNCRGFETSMREPNLVAFARREGREVLSQMR
jgi:hypothetical protein